MLTDLALASLQAREMDRACDYGHEIIAIAELGSGVLVKSLQRLDAQLDAFTDVPAMKELRREIRRVA